LTMISSAVRQSVMFAAFERVRDNHGCAGVDCVTIEKFEGEVEKNLAELSHELATGSYRPLPLIKIIVDKGNGEGRSLSIGAIRDRIAQTAVLSVIAPLFEAEFEDCSFAFRKGRSVRQAVDRIRKYYDQGFKWVVDADIDEFFNTVNHEILLKKAGKLIKDAAILRLIELWVKVEVWDGEALSVLSRGIPQGSVVSPILANLFLDELDEALLSRGYKLVRYADDFIILCKDKAEAEKALELTDSVLDKLSLTLDESDIVSFDQGFKFLGVLFLKSVVLVPYDRPKKIKRVIHYPDPINLPAYLLKREKGW